jgi:hypothetical protein
MMPMKTDAQLEALRVQLAQAEERADLAEKSATDAWAFARLMARTWRRRGDAGLCWFPKWVLLGAAAAVVTACALRAAAT